MEKFFKLKQYGTDVKTEITAGITTFFTMVYIIFVNPAVLSNTGMNFQAVFVATIIASVIGTLVMALFANVPYALAPGMGLNAFFTYTVCLGMHFTWQQGLAMVLICGIINILITVTGVRKAIIRSLPKVLQSAIGGGIGLFIAYIGIKDAGLIKFTVDPGTYALIGQSAMGKTDGTVIASASAAPGLVNLANPAVLLALIGMAIIIVLMARKVKGAILLGILSVTAFRCHSHGLRRRPARLLSVRRQRRNEPRRVPRHDVHLLELDRLLHSGAVSQTTMKMDFVRPLR
jgi:AGZA family xanthine/uracil permease-like MFS transporter